MKIITSLWVGVGICFLLILWVCVKVGRLISSAWLLVVFSVTVLSVIQFANSIV